MEVGVHVHGDVVPVGRGDDVQAPGLGPGVHLVADRDDHHDQVEPVQDVPGIHEVVLGSRRQENKR